MAALTYGSAKAFTSAPVAVARRQQQRAARPASRQLVRAAAEEEDPKFSFKNNTRGALGYTAEDSAGQSNIFSVEPKVYVQGSKADTTDSSPTITLAIGGFIFAMVAVGAGLIVNSEPTDLKQVAPTGEYKTLSEYKAQFAAELAPAAAPAVVDE